MNFSKNQKLKIAKAGHTFLIALIGLFLIGGHVSTAFAQECRAAMANYVECSSGSKECRESTKVDPLFDGIKRVAVYVVIRPYHYMDMKENELPAALRRNALTSWFSQSAQEILKNCMPDETLVQPIEKLSDPIFEKKGTFGIYISLQILDSQVKEAPLGILRVSAYQKDKDKFLNIQKATSIQVIRLDSSEEEQRKVLNKALGAISPFMTGGE